MTHSLPLSHRSSRSSSILTDPLRPAGPDDRPEHDESTLDIEEDIDVEVPPGADPEILALFSFTFQVPLIPRAAGLGAKVVYPHANANGCADPYPIGYAWLEGANGRGHEALIKAEMQPQQM